MKKAVCIILIIFIFVSNPMFYGGVYAYAESDEQSIEVQIQDCVNEQLENLDTTELEQLFSDLSNSNEIFKTNDFFGIIKKLISGEMQVDGNNVISYILKIFFDDVLNFLPYASLILAISVLYSMVTSSTNSNKSLGDIIHFVCFGAIVTISISCIIHLVGITTNCIGFIKKQTDIVFPILLTMITALGGNVSVSVFQPSMAILSGACVTLFTNILLPLFTFKIIFTVISNITSGVKFNKFVEFFGSSFKWILGGILTIFTAFLSISGIMAGGVDGISIKTAKYTIKSSIPLVGGFLSDGVSVMMLSCSLIKNAIGVSGLIMLFCTIIVPVLKIIVFSLLLKLVTAILEPIADARVTSFVGELSKSISTLVAIILGISFMYFVIVALIMCVI